MHRWVTTQCRSPQNVPRPRRTRGKPELGLGLPRRGRSGTWCRRHSRLSCASEGGHLRPTTPRAREICRSTSGRTCAVRACRLSALPRSRRARRCCCMGALLARDARPTNRAHGSAWGVCSGNGKGRSRYSEGRKRGVTKTIWRAMHEVLIYRCGRDGCACGGVSVAYYRVPVGRINGDIPKA